MALDPQQRQKLRRSFLMWSALMTVFFGGLYGIRVLIGESTLGTSLLEVVLTVGTLSAGMTFLDAVMNHGYRFRGGRITGSLIGLIAGISVTALAYQFSGIPPSQFTTPAGRLTATVLQLGLMIGGALFGVSLNPCRQGDAWIYRKVDALQAQQEERAERTPSASETLHRIKERFFPDSHR